MLGAKKQDPQAERVHIGTIQFRMIIASLFQAAVKPQLNHESELLGTTTDTF